jgi:NAD(P)-dependent dehydrogenase (short-subunit alcohol dehydrogenase family)
VGGGTGIAASTALCFAQAGASNISILRQSANTLNETKASNIASVAGAIIHGFSADVTKKDSVSAAFEAVHARVGEIRVFVSNAGDMSDLAPIAEADCAEWWRGFEVNVLGTSHATQAFLHFKAKYAVLINVSSGMAHPSSGPN